MKKAFFCYILLFAFLFLSNSNIKAQQIPTASLVVSGKDINEALEKYNDGILILVTKVLNNRVIPEVFIYNKNGAGMKKFIPLNFPELAGQTKNIPTNPSIYVLTLKWKYGEDSDSYFEFDPAKTYYLHPDISTRGNKKYLIYYFSDDPIPDKFVNKDAGGFNPIPPKLVP